MATATTSLPPGTASWRPRVSRGLRPVGKGAPWGAEKRLHVND